jgi:hypothetical protein
MALSLLLFVGGAPYWVESLEHVELPRQVESAPADTVVYPLLTVTVPKPLRILPSNPQQAALPIDTARPVVFCSSGIPW